MTSAAPCCIDGRTWLYTSSVILIDAWPNRSLTTFGFTPAMSSSVAQVWRSE